MTLRDRLDAVGLRAALGLPEPVQRRLVGKPVVRDGQTLATDVQMLLLLQRLTREPGAETLPMADGRRAIRRITRINGGSQPIGEVRALEVAGLPARLYMPARTSYESAAMTATSDDLRPGPGGTSYESAAMTASSDDVPATASGGDPLLLFFHGGGFMHGDLDSHDAACRFLAERSGVRVLSVDYRLGPEHPFPAAYDDAVAAYRWLVEHAESVGADPMRLAVGGDSAGGNLAAVVAIEAARAGLPLAFQLLVYPATDAARETASADLFAEGFYLTRDYMDLANASYLGDTDPRDPRISPAYADLPDGLAPAYVVTAGFDPLRDEGEAYARALAEAGAPVELRRFPGQIHGFFNVVGVGRTSRAANALIAVKLKAALTGSC